MRAKEVAVGLEKAEAFNAAAPRALRKAGRMPGEEKLGRVGRAGGSRPAHYEFRLRMGQPDIFQGAFHLRFNVKCEITPQTKRGDRIGGRP